MLGAHQVESTICSPSRQCLSPLLQTSISGVVLNTFCICTSLICMISGTSPSCQTTAAAQTIHQWRKVTPIPIRLAKTCDSPDEKLRVKCYLFPCKTHPPFHGTFSSAASSSSAALRVASTHRNKYEKCTQEQDLHPIVFCCICSCHKFRHLKAGGAESSSSSRLPNTSRGIFFVRLGDFFALAAYFRGCVHRRFGAGSWR